MFLRFDGLMAKRDLFQIVRLDHCRICTIAPPAHRSPPSADGPANIFHIIREYGPHIATAPVRVLCTSVKRFLRDREPATRRFSLSR